MLGIALGLSLVYECIRCMRARQKVRAEGENNFVTPNTPLPLPFLTRHITSKPHSSHNALYALLVKKYLSHNTSSTERVNLTRGNYENVSGRKTREKKPPVKRGGKHLSTIKRKVKYNL